MSDAARAVVLLTADSTFMAGWVNQGSEARVLRVPWIDGEHPLPAEVLARQIELTESPGLCIGPDVPVDLALAVAEELDLRGAPVGVVLVRTPDTELWRRAALAGVRDIVAPNTPLDEVRVSMAAAMARAERQRSIMSASTAPTSRVVVVLSPKGGSGKTMVSTNLAVALTRGGVNEVALVDLDCTFGDVSSVLGMVPDRTIGQLAALPAIDPTTVKVFLTRHVESGVQVMAGSGLPEEGEAVTAEVARQVIDTMAREFPFVVVDTAAGLDERALAAIDMATDLVFVASMDVTSIRNLGKEIDALDRLGATTARRLFVLNRADARVGLELHDVERALAMPVTASLPSSRLVPLSMNQGRTLVQSEPSSPVSQQIIQVARLLDPNVEPSGSAPEIDARKGLFRRKAT